MMFFGKIFLVGLRLVVIFLLVEGVLVGILGVFFKLVGIEGNFLIVFIIRLGGGVGFFNVGLIVVVFFIVFNVICLLVLVIIVGFLNIFEKKNIIEKRVCF